MNDEDSPISLQSGPNAAAFCRTVIPAWYFSIFALVAEGADEPGERAIQFLHSLRIPEGPQRRQAGEARPVPKAIHQGRAGRRHRNVRSQHRARQRKTALSAGIALGGSVGVWDRQPRREILIAARTRDQARIACDFVVGFAGPCPMMCSATDLSPRPRLEIEYEGDGGGHVLRAIAADGKSALGGARRWCSWMSAAIGSADQRRRPGTRAVVRSGQAWRAGADYQTRARRTMRTRFPSGWIEEPAGRLSCRSTGPPPACLRTIWKASCWPTPARPTASAQALNGCKVRRGGRLRGADRP